VKVIRRGRLTNEERERGFSVNSAPAPLPTYDALRDNNLRQYFESKTVQKFLQSSGWIDKEGRIVDLDKFRCVHAPPLLAASACRLCLPPLPAQAAQLHPGADAGGGWPRRASARPHQPCPPAGCCRLSAPSHPAAAARDRSKLNIIEQEFKYAEKTEFWRLKEEEEMRRTIQIKRERALLDAKRIERARRIKEENRITKGIISAVKNQPSADGAHQLLDMYVFALVFCVSPLAAPLSVLPSLVAPLHFLDPWCKRYSATACALQSHSKPGFHGGWALDSPCPAGPV